MTRGLWRLTLLWLALIGLPAAASAQISQAELRGVVHEAWALCLLGCSAISFGRRLAWNRSAML